MKRIDIVKTDSGWVGKKGNGQVVAKASTKNETVKKTAAAARADKDAVSVKIHKADGKFQEERTYPRSADPSTSKG